MKKILLLIMLFAIGVLNLNAQEADRLFEENDYDAALKKYLETYTNENVDDTHSYRIAICFINQDFGRERAIPYLEKLAVKYKENSKKLDAEVVYNLAIAQFHNESFVYADTLFHRYMLLKKAKYITEAFIYTRMCQNGIVLKNQELSVKFENLGRNINGKYSEYNPFVTEDEAMLVYTSNKKDDFNDVYVSRKKENENQWGKNKRASKLNSLYDVITSGMTGNGKILLVHSKLSPTKDIDFSVRRGRFTEIDNIGTKINTQYVEEGAWISDNQDTLFFASDKPGGLGGLDIYMSKKLPNGKWGIPINLGPSINTPYDDNYPNVSGNKLYYCSKGHTSMGGYDIFYNLFEVDEQEGIKFAQKAINFGYPINNTYDNFNISFLKNNRYAYTSSIRKEGFGGHDIYKLIFEDVEAAFIIIRGKISVGDSVSSVPLKDVGNEIYINVANIITQEVYTYQQSKTKGTFIMTLKPGKYRIEISGSKYNTYTEDIVISDALHDGQIISQNFFLKPK